MMAEPRRMIHIQLSSEEAMLVMEALAELPFKSVYRLIGELNRQANGYEPSEFGPGSTQCYALSPADLALALKALGNLPFHRVHHLANNLNGQIKAGLDGSGPDSLDVGR